MKTKQMIWSVLCALAVSGAVWAEEAGQSSTAIEVGNTLCPSSGQKVDAMGKPMKYEYNGKIYSLCCKMCVKDFEKDPEKLAKIAEDQAAKAKAESATTHG